MIPKFTITAFDAYLVQRNLRLEATVVGGSALALLGFTERPTRDFDIIHPHLPQEVLVAAQEFAAIERRSGIPLADDWLNNDPEQLGEVLPSGWQGRTHVVFEGLAIRLFTLDRPDLLKSKLFALCDRGEDWGDCVALHPTEEELDEAEPWLVNQDAHPARPEHVRTTLSYLKRRLGYGL